MSAYQTTAHRAYDRMMPGIVAGNPAHHCAFHTAGRVCRADCCQSECNRRESGLHKTSIHLKVPCY